MLVKGFCDLHKQQIAANDFALPNVMNHVIASTATVKASNFDRVFMKNIVLLHNFVR
jgi:hypothetical protein